MTTGRTIVAAAIAVAISVAGGACSGGGGKRRTVTVFAAASLSQVFDAMKRPFAAAQHRYALQYAFAGSQQLVAQLKQGARADVLATADRQTMSTAAADGVERAPVVFARNKLAIVVSRGNPNRVSGLADLARPGLRLVLAAPEVPAGRYARQALATARVTVQPVSLEDNVSGVVTKVALGEADAGIAYATDIARAPRVDAVTVPDSQNIVAEYLVAEPAAVDDRAGADAFIDFVRGPSGQRVLHRFGFLAP
jgi:molybdate transport system substrate-binding protein